MTPERLAEIRARAEAATEGPWRIDGRRVVYERDGWAEMVTPILHVSADATFIAAARTDVPELVAEVERLQARVGSCDGGCNYETGPEETCSLHGRPVAEVWQIVNDVAAERDARINALAQQVEKVRALHQPWDDGPQPYCTHDREPWPCPTEQALGAR